MPMKFWIAFLFSGAITLSAQAEQPNKPEKSAAGIEAVDLEEFNHLDPKHVVPDKPLTRALAYFKKNRQEFKNQKYIGVVDFTQHASKQRFYIIDMKSGKVERHAVAHGSGSDPSHTGMAKRFSNEHGSNASSIGFYRAAEDYNGNHGHSLRLDGLSKTNSNARARAIVLHSAWYVSDTNASGRSWGCFVVDEDVVNGVIKKLENGAMVYAYGGQGK